MESQEKRKQGSNLNIFRLLRIARDRKVKDLAKELSVTPAYINSIENGERYPSERLLRDYAEALGVSVEVIKNFNPDQEKGFERILLALLRTICQTDQP